MTKMGTSSARGRLILAASASAAALVAAAGPALAQSAGVVAASTVVRAVTVTATRTAQFAADVPVTVSVIPAEQIEDDLASDIKDLIRFEPGVSVRASPSRFSAALASTGRDGNSGFNIRGLEGNRVLIQVDGVRVPDAFSFGAQAVGRGDYVDLDLLKSVEIVRGPASALYGSDGLAGAVSFITKDPDDLIADGRSWAARGRAAYGSADGSWAKGAVLAGASGPWQAMVAYTRRDARALDNMGENEAANTYRTTPNPQDRDSNAVLAKLVFLPADGQRLRLTYDHFDSRVATDVLSAIARPPLGATSTLALDARDETSRDRIALDHLYESEDGLVRRAHWTAYYQTSGIEQFSAEDRNTAADRTRLNTFDNRVWGLSADLESRTRTGGLTHRFVYGADYSRTRQEGIRDGTVPPVGESFPTRAFPNTDYVLAGVFVQDEIKTADERLSVFPALRLDYYKLSPKPDALYPLPIAAGQSDARLSPKVGAVFRVTPEVSAFANYARGFKAPLPSQVNNGFTNQIINYTSLPNPDLKPETSETLEGGLRFGSGAWQASASAFAGWYDNFIDQVQVSGSFTPTDPAVFQYVNLGKVKITGAEARVQGRIVSGFGFTAAASYAKGDATFSGVTSPLDSIDPWKLVAGLTYRDPAGRFGGAVTATHSGRKAASRAGGVCAPACFRPPAFTILDATAYWNVTSGATLRAGVFNITNKKYWWWSDVRGLSDTAVSRDAYTQPGRNVGVSISYRF